MMGTNRREQWKYFCIISLMSHDHNGVLIKKHGKHDIPQINVYTRCIQTRYGTYIYKQFKFETNMTAYIARCIFTNNLWFRYLQRMQQNMISTIHWVIDYLHYIPVASPSSSITCGSTFLRCKMYLRHFSCVIHCRQNVRIPVTRSSLFARLVPRAQPMLQHVPNHLWNQ